MGMKDLQQGDSLRLKSDSVKNYLEFIFLRSVRQSGITIQEVRIPHPMK